MWFWLSLIAMLFWSGSDVFSKLGSAADDIYSHWKMVMSVGLVMGIHAFVTILAGTEFRAEYMLGYLPASFLYIASMVLGYMGLRYIMLSVSSPICNSSGAVAAVLCFIFLHQQLSGVQTVAVVLICLGVLGLGIVERRQDELVRRSAGESADEKYTYSLIAILFPVLYCILDGLGTFADALILDRFIAEESANIAYELTFFVCAIAAFVYVVIIKKQKLIPKREAPKLIAGVCETAGQLAYVYALGANAIAAAPLISAYCLLSVLWSRIFLKEKLTWQHYAVIAIAGVGIIILGAE